MQRTSILVILGYWGKTYHNHSSQFSIFMQKLLDIIRHSWFQDTWSIFDSYWSSWKCAVLLWKPTNYTKQTKVGVIQNLFVTKLGEPNGVVFTESQMISFTFSRNAGLGKRTRLAKVASHKTLQEILVIYLRSQKFLVPKLPLLQGFFWALFRKLRIRKNSKKFS